MEHRVESVYRPIGDDPKGGMWERFVQQQNDLLNKAASEGWRLVAAKPVTGVSHLSTSSGLTRLTAVLLYLSRD